VNLAQKVPQADHQGPGGAEKESADHPGELSFEQSPQKQGRQDGTDQQGGQGGGVDRPTGELKAPLQVAQFHSAFVMIPVARAAMEKAPPFDDAGQPARHHIEQAGDARQQKGRRQRELDGGGDTAIHAVGVMDQGQWHRSSRKMQVQLAASRMSLAAAETREAVSCP
jgi:hypothetical protein